MKAVLLAFALLGAVVARAQDAEVEKVGNCLPCRHVSPLQLPAIT